MTIRTSASGAIFKGVGSDKMNIYSETAYRLEQAGLVTREFYGTITFCFQQGSIVLIRKEETLKPSEKNNLDENNSC